MLSFLMTEEPALSVAEGERRVRSKPVEESHSEPVEESHAASNGETRRYSLRSELRRRLGVMYDRVTVCLVAQRRARFMQ